MKIHQVSLLFLFVGMMAACDSMNDLHDKYLEEGEIVYIARFDSLHIFPGINSVEFVYWLSDPKAKNVEVLWALGEKSFRTTVSLTTPNEPGRFLVEDIEEGNIHFDIFVYDAAFDERSVQESRTVSVLGSLFLGSLNNRELREFLFDRDYAQNLRVTWVNSVYPHNIGTEITYTTSTGKHVDTIARPGDSFDHLTIIDDIAVGSEFSFRVLYRPNLDSPIFSSEVTTLTVAIPDYYRVVRQRWSIPGYNAGSAAQQIGYSSQATNEGTAPQGRIIALLDDNTSTFWHASWSNPATVYPHWFVVDLNAEIKVSEIGLLRRQFTVTATNATARGYHVYTALTVADPSRPVPPASPEPIHPFSDLGYPWEYQGMFEFNPFNTSFQRQVMPNAPVARYVLVYFGPENRQGSAQAQFAEFAIWSDYRD